MKDPFRLDGKKVMVTGASRGIGKAIAAACARQGADLLLTARKEETLLSTAEELRQMGARCRTFPADLGKLEDTRRLMQWIEDQGPLDCYINNAAFTVFHYPLETPVEDMESLFHTNFRASVMLAQTAAKQMKNHGVAGSLLFITSINGISALPSQAFYSSTKAALESIMKSFASQLAPAGIRVNSIAPGAIMTDMNVHFTPEKVAQFSPQIPLGRIGDPEDIGDAAVFLCSNAARYITGSTLVVDGGYLLRR